MSVRAIMFPGQGSQSSGMGRKLFESGHQDVIRSIDAVLRYSIAELCLEGNGKLNQTEFTQPAIYVVNALSYAAYRAEGGAEPDYVAGHSLGEINALQAAGVLDLITGLRVVKKRAELMSTMGIGGMAAVIGLPRGDVENVIRVADSEIDIANINHSGQIAISGNSEHIASVRDELLRKGATAFVPLNVSGAFHSRFMRPAKVQFREFIEEIDFNLPRIPVISNLLGRPYRIGDVKDVLADQICNPVDWVGGIQYLKRRGVSEFLELGPGTVLTNLMRHIH